MSDFLNNEKYLAKYEETWRKEFINKAIEMTGQENFYRNQSVYFEELKIYNENFPVNKLTKGEAGDYLGHYFFNVINIHDE
jgi:hypothetical protein